MDGAPARRSRGGVSRESDGISGRDGGARPLRQTVSGVRDASTADSLCGQRDELLPDLSDRRQATRRSGAVASPQGGLAEVVGGAGGISGRGQRAESRGRTVVG